LISGSVWCIDQPLSTTKAQTASSDSSEAFRQLLFMPPPTPRMTEADRTDEAQEQRPPGFYADNNTPPDNAPTKDLTDYWERRAQSSSRNSPKPSDEVRRRLLTACEAEPKLLPQLLPLLPETEEAVERVKKLYDGAQGNAHYDDGWHKKVREWLKFHSTYFLSELISATRKVKDKDGYVDNEEELKALAQVDWASAEPLLEGLADGSQPRAASLALALLYNRAVKIKDADGEEKHRARLQAIAADRNAPARARDTAIETLSLAEWTGRDDWYLSLFSDETLLEPIDGSYLLNPLTTLFVRDPDKWIPVMTRLVESKDRAVRQAAASCLVEYATAHPRRDAILPVLRWLSDSEWLDINGTDRAHFIQTMNELDMPESVPGLIWIVENEDGNRQWAARTLAHYKDQRAVPALKKALAEEKSEDQRVYFIEGLLASGGIPEAEQVAALEAYAEKLATTEGRAEVERYRSHTDKPLPLPISIGKYLARVKQPPDALVREILSRSESLQKKNPAQARVLLGIAQGWEARQVDLDTLQRISTNAADAATIAGALERRAKLRMIVEQELQSLASVGGAARGVAAILLADESLTQNTLNSNDQPAQVALLACARLTQTPLPVAQVGSLLQNKNAMLALAAERYLLAEDSTDARRLLWAHHRNKAFITGWRENIPLIGGSNFNEMVKAEESLRAELLKENAPLEVFALLTNNERPSHVVRVYPNKTVYTHYEDAARYRERVVTNNELAQFKNFITTNNLTELGPQLGSCHHDCFASEFLSLTKQGGRRVFSHQGISAWITVVANFDLLGRGEGAKIHYRLEDEIKGLEVLHADDALVVKDIWAQGADVRVLVEREETAAEIKQDTEITEEDDDDNAETLRAQRRRIEAARSTARLSWRAFTNAKLGAPTATPELHSSLSRFASEIDDEEFPSHFNDHLTQATTGEFIILAGSFSEGGLWKMAAGQKPTRISGEGGYASPLVTPDGKWVVAAKTDTDWGQPNYIVRFDLRTGREHRISIPPAGEFAPVAYLASHGKVLLRRASDEDAEEEKGEASAPPEFYLLDPVTGRTQVVTGVFTPLLQMEKRGLQPTGIAGEFWVALPDRTKNQTSVGRYRVKDFSFRTSLVVPHLSFDSMAMWVDEERAKLYVIYEGQLLRLPLGKVQ
jgi:hypothetical protein